MGTFSPYAILTVTGSCRPIAEVFVINAFEDLSNLCMLVPARSIKVAIQKSVQKQNADEKTRIKECALDFRSNRDSPQALLDCFEAFGIDLKRDILIDCDRYTYGYPNPYRTAWVKTLWNCLKPFGVYKNDSLTAAYCGIWLTEQLQFIEYEIYLDPKDRFVAEIDTWKNVTDTIEINGRKKGTGKSPGWLAIEVLNELNVHFK